MRRPSCCARSRRARSSAWAGGDRSRWTCASSPPPTWTSSARLAILHAGEEVLPSDVSAVLSVDRSAPPTPETPPDPVALDRPLSDALDDFERILITRALSAAGG